MSFVCFRRGQHQLWRIYIFYFRQQLFQAESISEEDRIIGHFMVWHFLDWQAAIALFSNRKKRGTLQSIFSAIQTWLYHFSLLRIATDTYTINAHGPEVVLQQLSAATCTTYTWPPHPFLSERAHHRTLQQHICATTKTENSISWVISMTLDGWNRA